MCENVGFQQAAGVLMALFVPRLAAIEALRWSLTSLVSRRKAFRGRVGEDGGVLTLFPLRTETPSVSPTSGQNQTRPYGEKMMELGKRDFLTNGCLCTLATVGKAKFNRKLNYKGLKSLLHG